MGKRLLFLSLLVAMAFLPNRDCHAAKEQQVIRVGCEDNFYPYTFVDEQEGPSGFGAELIKAVAATMGLTIEWSTGTWDTRWNGLVSGQLDVLPVVAKLPNRVGLADFSLPHTETFDAFFVRKGDSPIQDLAAARGKSIVVMRSDASHHSLLNRHFEGSLVLVNTIPEGLALVASGQHDAFLGSKLICTLAINKFSINGLVPGKPIPDYKRVFSFAVKKGDEELREKLNQGLLIIKTNGEYERLYQKWLAVDDPVQRYWKYFMIALAIPLVISLIVGGFLLIRNRFFEQQNILLKQEIVERQNVEASLRESEEQYRMLFNSTSDITFIVDIETMRFLKVNIMACKRLGYTEAELLTMTPIDLHESKDTQYVRQRIDQIKRRGTLIFDAIYVAKDGSSFPVEISATALVYKDRPAYISTVRDITERLKAQNESRLADIEMRNSLARQSITLRSVGDGIISVDPQARVELLNPVAEQLTGWAQADAVGRPLVEVFRIINEETRATAEDPVAKVLRLGMVVGLANHTLLITKDGMEIPIADSAAPILGGKAEILGVVLVFRDQTEERKAAKALQESAEKALALAEKSEAANKAKSVFLANMSHEIRTPLNGVLGMLQLIRMSGLSSEVECYVEMALRSGQRLTSLLGDILDLSRIEAGRMLIASNPFALVNILTAIAETFSPLNFSKGLPLAIRIAPDVPTTLGGDEIRVRQILFNLVGNAIKFTDRGEVTLEVSSLLPHPSGMVRLLFIVSDSGPGIPEAKLDQICGSFVQVSEDFTRSQQGAGLGLAIVQRLVNAMKGSLTFDSTEGVGTTVYLTLPFALAEHSVAAPQPKPGAETYPPLRILLVEDEEISRLSALMILKRMGHEVATANDGLDALSVVRHGNFDCILMDVQMPVMSGVEATKRIRSGSSGALDAHVPIIAMTAYAMTGDRERFIEAGMDDYVAKPVQVEELMKALERVMEKRVSSAGQ